ncbi:MAG: hypothetical protein WKF43_07650 [Acidimicrobiales bacterium]
MPCTALVTSSFAVATTLATPASLLALTITSTAAEAAAFGGAGNLVVVRIGDGAAALSSAATPLCRRVHPNGTIVQTLPRPHGGAGGSGAALTDSGSATSEGG